MVRIDASLLKKLGITLFYKFYQLIFDIPQRTTRAMDVRPIKPFAKSCIVMCHV